MLSVRRYQLSRVGGIPPFSSQRIRSLRNKMASCLASAAKILRPSIRACSRRWRASQMRCQVSCGSISHPLKSQLPITVTHDREKGNVSTIFEQHKFNVVQLSQHPHQMYCGTGIVQTQAQRRILHLIPFTFRTLRYIFQVHS